MNYRVFTVLAGAVLLTAFSVGTASAADPEAAAPIEGRRFDFALGVGAQVHLSNKVPVDDNLMYGGSLTVELSDHFDGEFGTLVVDTHRIGGDGDPEDGEHQTVNYIYGGVRLNATADQRANIRPYLFLGLTEYWGLDKGKNRTGYMVGPGLRFRPGDDSRFGFTLKAPLVFQFNDDAYPRMLPQIEFFWSFDFADGGFH
jgi:hypothetical protein